MSKERCQAVKQQMKAALGILQSGSCGQGRGASLAMTYLEDAYLRVDYHMRENGWFDDAVAASTPVAPKTPQATSVMSAPQMAAASQPRPKSTLVPAGQVPQLRTGLMGPPPTASTDSEMRRRDVSEVMDDLSVLP